jgi:hypothetical protein
MNITIINDCRDENAAGRQKARISGLFGAIPVFIGVADELEAAGSIIDILDALGGGRHLILVNVAPRGGTIKKWENGTPFGYFHYKETLVISTIDGKTLSLVKKFGLTECIHVFDTACVVEELIGKKFLSAASRDHVIESQFRSFDFLPRIAASIAAGNSVTSERLCIDSVPSAPPAIWYVDNFGNCKTTLLPEEVSFRPGEQISTKLGRLRCYRRLRDVPRGETALIIGSSGLEEKRFLEIVAQGENAAKKLNAYRGCLVL